jgi:hypothetical protein
MCEAEKKRILKGETEIKNFKESDLEKKIIK